MEIGHGGPGAVRMDGPNAWTEIVTDDEIESVQKFKYSYGYLISCGALAIVPNPLTDVPDRGGFSNVISDSGNLFGSCTAITIWPWTSSVGSQIHKNPTPVTYIPKKR